jgi:predicted DNA-binding protein (UPF0251 family)
MILAVDRMQAFVRNTLAQEARDNAYTLAFYLLGDESLAAQATWEAFQQARRKWRDRPGVFRLEVFRGVVAFCCAQTPALRRGAQEPFMAHILCLRAEQRAAVVLVDILRLSYEESSTVLGCSTGAVARLVAQARVAVHHAVMAGRE